MTNTNSVHDLGRRIEQLVQEHIAASQKAVQEAVERAFGAAAGKRGVPPRRRVATPGPASQKRRASAELAALGERFYSVVCAKPGETMTVLAAEVGASARELNRSVALLRRAGRVRAVGQRSQTRYFPMASGSRGSAQAATA
jgi:hypothetical protein